MRHVLCALIVLSVSVTSVTAQTGDVIVLGFSANEESQKMRAFFERGNRATLDSLVKRFAKP